MFTKKERERYNEQRERICQRLGITKNQYNWFRRKGEALHRIYEANCNGDYDKLANNLKDGVSAEAMYDIDCATKEGLIIAKAKKLRLFVYFQTDPRGATIYLDKVSIPENNYTQSYCIY